MMMDLNVDALLMSSAAITGTKSAAGEIFQPSTSRLATDTHTSRVEC